MILINLEPKEVQEEKMENQNDIFDQEVIDQGNGSVSDQVRNASTLRRQIAYDLAVERIRADIARKRRPLPVLFDDEGKWICGVINP